MANRERAYCLLCERELTRSEIHLHRQHIPAGYTCRECGTLYTKEMIPLVPVTAIIKMDPGLAGSPILETYKAILIAFKNPEKNLEKNLEKDKGLSDKTLSVFQKYCRENIQRPGG
jgi:hypothetical protein